MDGFDDRARQTAITVTSSRIVPLDEEDKRPGDARRLSNLPMNQEITLSREINAIQIPSGDTISLPTGTVVVITQNLGGTYTVATSSGLARISSNDADALGIDQSGQEERPREDERMKDAPVTDQIWHQLRQVYDPEIPVDIVNLGLVYDCTVDDEDGQNVVSIKMTLTAPGCGMGPAIAADAQARIMTIDQIDDARVELVWDPPWNQDMISEEGKMKLGMISSPRQVGQSGLPPCQRSGFPLASRPPTPNRLISCPSTTA